LLKRSNHGDRKRGEPNGASGLRLQLWEPGNITEVFSSQLGGAGTRASEGANKDTNPFEGSLRRGASLQAGGLNKGRATPVGPEKF